MFDIYPLLRPLFFAMDAERAHDITLHFLKSGVFPRPTLQPDPVLESEVLGLRFPNPVGLSAGFDKKAEVIAPMFKLGFGFVEVGTVTPKPQAGNDKPRVFRSPSHGAVINRMGFPNGGVTEFKDNLTRFLARKNKSKGVVGLNIGMNKTQNNPADDYCLLIKMLAPMADYITVNISSPNTPGLRNLQSREPLLELISAMHDARRKACGNHPPPLLVKLAPDLDEAQQEELAQTALDAKIDGLILTNTTLRRPDYLPTDFRAEAGGLSGQPVKDQSTEVLRNFYQLTQGAIPLIGVGGVASGADAYEKIRAGASLVQLYSALAFEGPFVANSVNNQLAELLKRDGFSSVADAVGADH